MQLAVDEVSGAASIGLKRVTDIHARLVASAPDAHVAGLLRTSQNWIGGNDYNPCGADFVPPPHDPPLSQS